MRHQLGGSAFRRSFASIVFLLVFIVGLLAGSGPAAKAQSSDLFADAGPAALADAGRSAVRARLVTVNVGMLLDERGRARDVSAVPEVSLNLFPDASYTGVITQVSSPDADTYSWSGTLKDVTGGYFFLVSSGGAFIAHVASTQGIYEVSSAGNGQYRVIQIDQSKFVDEPAGGPLKAHNSAAPMASDGVTAADAASRIDVMILYTPAARVGEGGAAAMKARVALAIAETNQGYANAGVTTRLRLVHTQEIAYTETGSFGTDLARLANPSDGFMTSVPTLRNRYGADMVQLIENAGDACGIAYLMNSVSTSFAPYAFSVVERDCMTGYYSSGHEFGHNQGADHDMFVASGDSVAYPYAHGFVHIGVDQFSSWRTVMAYNNACDNAFPGTSCTRLLYWSNPGVTYNTAAMGDSSSQNYQVLNNTAATVANFRKQVIANDFNSDFTGNHSGWTPVSGTWGVSGGAYYRTVGVSGLVSSVVHAGKYGDFTYTARVRRTGSCTGCDSGLLIRGNPAALTAVKDWRPSYYFGYTNSKYVAVVYVNSAGSSTPLKNWTLKGAVVANGWNTLKVVAVGPTLRYYVNNVLVWGGQNAALQTGRVGIYMYGSASPGQFLVDYANLATTPTAADPNPFADAGPALSLSAGQGHMP